MSRVCFSICFCIFQEVDVRFIEYMPFDGNKWNQRKMVPYAEMISHIRRRYLDIIRLTNTASDTSKVCILLFLKIFLTTEDVIVNGKHMSTSLFLVWICFTASYFVRNCIFIFTLCKNWSKSTACAPQQLFGNENSGKIVTWHFEWAQLCYLQTTQSMVVTWHQKCSMNMLTFLIAEIFF